MYSAHKGTRIIGLALTTAMTGALLAGCAAKITPLAQVSASAAPEAATSGKNEQAAQIAEAAVLSEPRNAALRAALGDVYLEAGRFASAETTFNDAIRLGDNSPRTALSLALALTAQAKGSEAAALLNDRENEIATADLGLALSLAGQPQRGIHIMSNAIRGGENTVKMRQNLAYSYAVAGRWREARLMAAQDVPAGEVGARMERWALMSHPAAYQHRVANLLGVPAGVHDSGLPVQLALANYPAVEQLATEANASEDSMAGAHAPIETVEAPPSGSKLPIAGKWAIAPNESGSSAMQRRNNSALGAVARITYDGSPGHGGLDPVRLVRTPGAPTPPQSAAAPAQRAGSATPPADAGEATHLVQLGSFVSDQRARHAWGIYVSRYPELAQREMVITEAVVRGKRYWRVSAAGYSREESRSTCQRIASRGEGCIAWAASSPLPGAVAGGMRLARR